MKTVVNIGTDIKNITGISFEKPFNEITFEDIQKVVIEKLGKSTGWGIQGWANVTPYKNKSE